MLPFAMVLAVLLASPVGAGASIAVGPDGIVDPMRGEPYYVWLIVRSPEAPGAGSAEDDCGAGSRPALIASANSIVGDFAAWDPMTDFGGGTWFPTCVAGTTECEPSTGMPCFPLRVPIKAYAAYDVTTGRYYLELGSDAFPGFTPAASTIALTGSTGAGILMDCVGCGPPVCCDN